MAMFNASISIHALAKRATKSLEYDFIPSFISIHALAKRATSDTRLVAQYNGISIHALAKRATLISKCYTGTKENFNPRPRKEGDSLFTVLNTVADTISIHALAKRAT